VSITPEHQYGLDDLALAEELIRRILPSLVRAAHASAT